MTEQINWSELLRQCAKPEFRLGCDCEPCTARRQQHAPALHTLVELVRELAMDVDEIRDVAHRALNSSMEEGINRSWWSRVMSLALDALMAIPSEIRKVP